MCLNTTTVPFSELTFHKRFCRPIYCQIQRLKQLGQIRWGFKKLDAAFADFIIMGSVICPEITSIISKPGWSCGSWRFACSFSIYGITILSSNLNDSGVFYSIAFHFRLNESGSLTREILLLVFPQKISCIGRNLFSHLMPNVAVITCLNYSHVFWFFR